MNKFKIFTIIVTILTMSMAWQKCMWRKPTINLILAQAVVVAGVHLWVAVHGLVVVVGINEPGCF